MAGPRPVSFPCRGRAAITAVMAVMAVMFWPPAQAQARCTKPLLVPQPPVQQFASGVAVLEVGGRPQHGRQQAQAVHPDRLLAALDLLAAVEAALAAPLGRCRPKHAANGPRGRSESPLPASSRRRRRRNVIPSRQNEHGPRAFRPRASSFVVGITSPSRRSRAARPGRAGTVCRWR